MIKPDLQYTKMALDTKSRRALLWLMIDGAIFLGVALAAFILGGLFAWVGFSGISGIVGGIGLLAGVVGMIFLCFLTPLFALLEWLRPSRDAVMSADEEAIGREDG